MKPFPFLLKSFTVLLLITFSYQLNAAEQQFDYDKAWKSVEENFRKGLPKTAAQTLDLIRQNAIDHNNEPQLLKTILYQFRVFEQTSENPTTASIRYAHGQLNLLSKPSKALLRSIIAEQYIRYYQQNRYYLLERPDIAGNNPIEPDDWSLGQLRDTIRAFYEASLPDFNTFDTIAITDYQLILNHTEAASISRIPTLFDLLTQRALEFYLNTDAGLNPAPLQQITVDKAAWLPAPDFALATLPASETPAIKALKLMQPLLRNNLSRKHYTAYVHNDLKRLQLLYELQGQTAEAAQNYQEALKNLIAFLRDKPESTEALAALSQHLIDQQNSSADTTFSQNKAKALELCEQAIKSFPESSGSLKCKNIKADILQKHLQISLQGVSLPDQPVPVQLSYKNTEKLFLKIIRISSDELADVRQQNDIKGQLTALNLKPVITKLSHSIPFEKDYSSHQAILSLPPLKAGLYVVLASHTADFNSESTVYADFQLSRLSFVEREKPDHSRFFVLDRETGKGLKNVEARLMIRTYDYSLRDYRIENFYTTYSDKNGSFIVDQNAGLPKNQSYYVELNMDGDTLYSSNFFDLNAKRPERKLTKTWYFTDRAIYRPGQTVYFKGITLEKQSVDYQLADPENTVVELRDANNQVISTLKLTTNDYSSFEGRFVLPQQGLNGRYTLRSQYGSASFQVEAYKRPQFEVKLPAPEAQYKLGETIQIKGEARAFAGFALDSVKVRYSIERQLFYPFYRHWWGLPPVMNQSSLIASGTTITNQDGEFSIPLELLPAPGTHASQQPFFHFVVQAEVIDKQGEMQSASLTLPAAWQALQLKTNLPEMANQQQLMDYSLLAQNLQNEATTALVKRSFYLLDPPDAFEAETMFLMNDRKLLSQDSLQSLFPHWNYYPLSPEKRNKTLIFSDSIAVSGDTTLFPKNAGAWPVGEYLLVLEAKDLFDAPVKNEKTFSLFNPQSKNALPGNIFLTSVSKQMAQPGEVIHFTVGTDAADAFMLVEIYAGDALRYSEWLKLDKKQQQLSYTVQEADRGKLNFQAVMVRYGRVFTKNTSVEVPFDNRKLDIELLTLRDQLSPGTRESWELIIRNPQKQGIKAELLAAMYDASLDQIMPHQWSFNILPNTPAARGWSVDRGFFTNGSTYLYHARPQFDYPPALALPEINYFGLGGFYGNRMLKSHHAHDDGVVLEMVLEEEEVAPVTAQQNEMQEEISNVEITKQEQQNTAPPLRTNFNETAFFYPQLLSDEEGIVRMKFTTPDALTRWKLMLLAHDKQLNTGLLTKEFNSNKPLMIMGNLPRFYYQGDSACVSARIVNTGDEVITGIARLEIMDAISLQPIELLADAARKPIVKLQPGQSMLISWNINLTTQPGLLAFKFSATAGTYTDAEQKLLPVLTNEKLITNRMAITVLGEKEKTFTMTTPDKDFLTKQLQLQVTPNPVWFAIQSLPYLSESNSKNADQLFYRLYTNLLAGFVADQIPQLKATIERWKNAHPETLWSELQKNPELKTLAVNQTPWLSAAEAEAAQKAQLVELFNLNRISYEINNGLDELQQLQLANGAWPWFRGMRESRFITRLILEGFGNLEQLGIKDDRLDAQSRRIISQLNRKAYGFISGELTADYVKLRSENRLEKYVLSTTHLNELYALSFSKIVSPEGEEDEARRFFLQKTENDWLRFNPGDQATAALVLYKNGRKQAAADILKSLLERSFYFAELGRTWKNDPYARVSAQGIEDQSRIITAFETISDQRTEIDQMKQWLLAHKRTNSWNNSKATAEAINALLSSGTSWIENYDKPEISINNTPLDLPAQEAGTGYFQLNLNSNTFVGDSLKVRINNPNQQVLWGGLFHSYSQKADQLEATDNQLKVEQKLFIQSIVDGKQKFIPYEESALRVGDKLLVQIHIQSDRTMEYLHLRHHRPAAAEPLTQLSGYQYHDGLGYYQSNDDTGTDFFIGTLPKGSFWLQLELKVEQAGSFSGGYVEIYSYYAPEFGSNSEGIRLDIRE